MQEKHNAFYIRTGWAAKRKPFPYGGAVFLPKHIFKFFFIFFLLALILAPVSPARAAGIRYAAPSAVGSGNCSSWANACTMQTALARLVIAAAIHHSINRL